MPDVCPSERRALALSQHECREGPAVKVPVIIPVGAWNVRLLQVFWGEPEKSISLCGGENQPAESLQTDTFVVFVSTALIYRAGSMTTYCLQRVSTRCSWFLKLMNISCVKQLQQEPCLKSVTSERRLQLCLSLSPSIEMKGKFSFSFQGKSSLHIQRPFNTVCFLCESCSSRWNRTSKSFFSKLWESQQGKWWQCTAHT